MKTKNIITNRINWRVSTLFTLLLSLFVFAGCSKDDNGINPGTGGNTGDIEFNIGFAPQDDGKPQTLVATDADFKSTWEDGDEIGIFAVKRAASDTKGLAASDNYIHNVKLTYNSTDDKWTAESELWHPNDGEVLDFYAYYPYNNNGGSPQDLDPANIAFNVNGDQSTAANYSQSDLLSAEKVTGIAKGTAVNLQFKHMLSLVQVEVAATYIDRNGGFTATLSGCKVGGTFNLAAGSLTTTGNAVAVKMLRVEADPATDTTYTYRALVPAQSVVSGTSLCLMAQNEQLFSTPKLAIALELSAGEAKLYTATLPIAALPKVAIKSGSFIMGNSDGSNIGDGDGSGLNTSSAEPNRSTNEAQHRVTLTKDFYISKYAVTNAQYAAFLNDVGVGSDGKWATGSYPDEFLIGSHIWGLKWDIDKWIVQTSGYDNYPIIYVSWHGAMEHASWLSDQTGGAWRLPTEAEWEYACRGDYPNKATEAATLPFGLGDGSKLDYTLGNFYWEYSYKLPGGQYEDNTNTYHGKTMPVGSYASNSYGLYDMHGNVFEWCSDNCAFPPADYGAAAATDPTGPDTGSNRVLRGGSWFNRARYCRSAFRSSDYPDSGSYYVGFRVVFVP